MWFQQGDVKIEPVYVFGEFASTQKVPSHNGQFILSHGENGHNHTVTAEPGVEAYEVDGTLYLKADKPVKVEHPEHDAGTIEPGIYRVGHVQQFDYWNERPERVVD